MDGGGPLDQPSFAELSPQQAADLVRHELTRDNLSADAEATLWGCLAEGMSGEQLAGVMTVLSRDQQAQLLVAVGERSPERTQEAFMRHWDFQAGTPKLVIKEHISTDVLWPTLTKFTPSEIRSLLSQKPGAPSEFTQRTAPALQKTAANFTPLAQVKGVFKRDVTTGVLVEPTYRAAGEHWAVEAGGVTAEMIKTSGALGWWVPQQGALFMGTLNYREKFGLAYANVEARHPDIGTARASVSSGTQLFAWGTASVRPTEWDVGAFVGAEAVGLKVSGQYQAPMLPVPGTLGIVRAQFSIAGDVNLGAAGADIGLGARGRTDGSQFSLYGQVGFSPGAGWRVLPILDVAVDVEKAGALGAGIAQEYRKNPSRLAVESTLAAGGILSAVSDPGQAMTGLYLDAALRVVVPKAADELMQLGRDLRDGVESLTERASRWLSATAERP